jgi:hypothetical protein
MPGSVPRGGGESASAAFLPRIVNVRRGGIAVAAILAVTGLVFAWQASLIDLGDFGLPGPGFLPLVLGVVIAALAAVIGAECWRGTDAGETVALGHRDVLIVFVALLAVPPLFEPLGAYITLGLFGAVLLVLIARRSIVLAGVAAVIAMVACWYFFQVALGLQLPVGPL